MAFAPDDDRFYQILANAGATNQKYTDKVAEDQANTTLALGQLYGKAIGSMPGTVLNAMSWRQNRDLQQDQNDRQQAGEGRNAQRFAEDEQDRATALAAAQKEAQFQSGPADEEYASMAGVPYHPGMTRGDVAQLAGINKLGFEGRKLTSEEKRAADTLSAENMRASNTQLGETERSKAQIAAANSRNAADIAAANLRQGNTLDFDREKLAQEKELEAGKLAKKDMKIAPAELVAKMGEAESAQKSLDNLWGEWKDKANSKISPITQFFPNTDASRYDDAANINAQVVGKFLEEGRMTDADVPRYKAMMPSPTDSPERAQEKITRMSKMIADKKQEHMNALQGAGYSVGNQENTGAHNFALGDEAPPNSAAAAPARAGGDPQVMGYAQQHGLSYDAARTILKGRGYAPAD